MSASGGDARRWDARWTGSDGPGEPEPWLVARRHLLPGSGRAIDLAGGTGRNALWLASQGFDTTLVDVSGVALDLARRAADAAALALTTEERDLAVDGPPDGSWDVAVVVRYLDRQLLRALTGVLTVGGVAVLVLPTVSNLERHDRPSRRHLLDDGELAAILDGIDGLDVIEVEEGWTERGTHEARAVVMGR